MKEEKKMKQPIATESHMGTAFLDVYNAFVWPSILAHKASALELDEDGQFAGVDMAVELLPSIEDKMRAAMNALGFEVNGDYDWVGLQVLLEQSVDADLRAEQANLINAELEDQLGTIERLFGRLLDNLDDMPAVQIVRNQLGVKAADSYQTQIEEVQCLPYLDAYDVEFSERKLWNIAQLEEKLRLLSILVSSPDKHAAALEYERYLAMRKAQADRKKKENKERKIGGIVYL
jgi:hypothetical protein